MRRLYPATANDYRELARRRLPGFLFDYIDGGAGAEQTLAANVADYCRWQIRQRVLQDVTDVQTSTTLAGHACALPLALAPIGLAGMMARRGEAVAACVAAAFGVPFTLSTVGICALPEVRLASGKAPWFQLYMLRDRGLVRALLDEAWANDCRTLVFTVDLPVAGMRHRDTRHGLGGPGLRPAVNRLRQVLARPRWLWDVPVRGKPLTFGSLAGQVQAARNLDAFKAWVDTQFDPAVVWRDIDWLRDCWKGQLLLKGIAEVDDARAAVRCGADGLVVSNHGGRQLDGTASSITKLRPIAQAIGGDCEVMVDGGVRGGSDIFKALALGARGVLIGRAWIWALAGAGAVGLRELLNGLQRELRVTMTLAGVTRIADIGERHLDGL